MKIEFMGLTININGNFWPGERSEFNNDEDDYELLEVLPDSEISLAVADWLGANFALEIQEIALKTWKREMAEEAVERQIEAARFKESAA